MASRTSWVRFNSIMRVRHVLAAAALALACEQRPSADPANTELVAADSVRTGVVDSVFPVEEEIRRFMTTLSGPLPTALQNATGSREALAQRFMTALVQNDTAAIHKLVLSPAEFIELYYPFSQYTKPPYKQSPGLLWFLIQQNSQKGISRALQRFGGNDVGYQRIDCQEPPEVQGRNRFWTCVVRWTPEPNKPDPLRLFGSIMERDGRFKFVSYANGL